MTTEKATGPVAPPTEPRQAQTKTNTPIVAPAEKTGKPDLTRDPHFQDLQTRLGQRGYSLQASVTGAGVYVSRWGLVKFFQTLPEAESFAIQVGAR